MAEVIVDNQRVAVVVAVILAALTAAGLWYFFVWREATPEEFVVATPTPFIEAEAPLPAVVGIVDTTSGSLAQVAETAPVQVTPTATTGPGAAILVAAVGATVVGLRGLRRRARAR